VNCADGNFCTRFEMFPTDSKENHMFTTQIVDDFVYGKQAYM